MHLPIYVKKVLAALENRGHECYCVGGCVRDSLLSLPVSDYDITTSALPSETKAALCDFKVIETGLRHGTVTAISDSHHIEITTYRNESGYSDHRRPDTVSFSNTLKEDLSRRDFTVNAMAFSEDCGIIDLFGGKKDLECRLIRTVGDPGERFNEDALRILRALRFSACLNFSIEEKTAAAILENNKLLSYVSKERIYAELCRLICGDNAAKVLKKYFEVFAFILSPKNIDRSCWNKCADSLADLPQKPYIRFAAMFRALGGSDAAYDTLLSLKSNKDTASSVCLLLSALPFEMPKTRIEIKKLLKTYTEQTIKDLILLCGGDFDFTENQISDIKNRGECFRLSSLKIGGDDLTALGFKGKEIGSALDSILNLVIEEKLPNDRSELISFAENLK